MLGASLLVVACLAHARAADAACQQPLSDLGGRLERLGHPTNLALLGAAVVTPFALAPTGVDWAARDVYLRDLGGRYDPEETSKVAPYALAAALATGWGAAVAVGDCGASRVAGRGLQAVLLTGALQAGLKIVVGRTWPATAPARYFVDDGRAYEARPFGTFGAWPSGHTATTFAFASAIRAALPRRAGPWRYAGYALAVGVAAGMLVGDHHWTSDVVSGALLGEAVGGALGGEPDEARGRVALVPNVSGLALTGVW